jgi:pimeloyl-ACP methyl ester carboxylesterase
MHSQYKPRALYRESATVMPPQSINKRTKFRYGLTIGFVASVGVALPVGAQQGAGKPTVRTVSVDGHPMRVRVSGLENRLMGRPIVVFEAGATNTLNAWDSVFSRLVGASPLVAYDRSGLGGSAWDGETPTPRHVADKLRRLLSVVGADPPYVLVGHSWGGSLMRYFAGYYPDETVGIVYVDPAPLVTQSVTEELAPFVAIGAGRAGYEAFWSAYAGLMERASPAARAEFNVYRGLMQREVQDRDLRDVPVVPTVVIVAAKPYPALPGLPFDPQKHFAADLRHRIEVLQKWGLGSAYGTIVITNHSTHAVPREDPDVVVWAVKRVLGAIAR